MKYELTKFGVFVKGLIQEADITMTQAAKSLGLAQTKLSKILRDNPKNYKNIPDDLVDKIIALFNLEMDDINALHDTLKMDLNDSDSISLKYDDIEEVEEVDDSTGFDISTLEIIKLFVNNAYKLTISQRQKLTKTLLG